MADNNNYIYLLDSKQNRLFRTKVFVAQALSSIDGLNLEEISDGLKRKMLPFKYLNTLEKIVDKQTIETLKLLYE